MRLQSSLWHETGCVWYRSNGHLVPQVRASERRSNALLVVHSVGLLAVSVL